jgi:hypothetical protein
MPFGLLRRRKNYLVLILNTSSKDKKMKAQNSQFVAKACQLDKQINPTVFFLTIVVVMAMTFYNSTVFLDISPM